MRTERVWQSHAKPCPTGHENFGHATSGFESGASTSLRSKVPGSKARSEGPGVKSLDTTAHYTSLRHTTLQLPHPYIPSQTLTQTQACGGGGGGIGCRRRVTRTPPSRGQTRTPGQPSGHRNRVARHPDTRPDDVGMSQTFVGDILYICRIRSKMLAMRLNILVMSQTSSK